MAFNWPENNINFGVPEITIEQTLSNLYDPYSGINLLDDYRETCDYLEIMLLPSGDFTDTFFCEDGFASTGPIYYGGTGDIGNCFNNGTVNVRYLGGYSGAGDNTTVADLESWYSEATVTEPFHHISNDGVWPEFWTPNVWGYEFEDTINSSPFNQQNLSKHTTQQLSSFNFNFFDTISPFENNMDSEYNLTEMRGYFNSDEDGEYRFCFYADNIAGVFINDGATTDLLLQNVTTQTGFESGIGASFEKTLSTTQLYKILVRHEQQTGTSSFDMAIQSPSSRITYGDLPCNADFYKDLHPGVSKVIPTTIDPPLQQEWSPDEFSGDGLFYKTNQTPFAGTQEISDYLQVVDCNTIFNIELFNFDELRAVCKDGSYVTVASSGGAISVLTPYGTSDEITEQVFENPTKPGNSIDTLTDDQIYALNQQSNNQEGFDWFPEDYSTMNFPIGVFIGDGEDLTSLTADEFCKEQGYNQGAVAFEFNGTQSETFGVQINDGDNKNTGLISVRFSNGLIEGPWAYIAFDTSEGAMEDGWPDEVSRFTWEYYCDQVMGLFNGRENCEDYVQYNDTDGIRHGEIELTQGTDEEIRERAQKACARIYGSGGECTRTGHDTEHFSHGEDYRIWPTGVEDSIDWSVRSDDYNDYLVEGRGRSDDREYYSCHDGRATYTQPNVPLTMVYWSTDIKDLGWVILPISDTLEGGTNGNGIADLGFFTSITCQNDATEDSDFIYESGEQACRTMEQSNSNLFYQSDADGRPSLALITTREDNRLSDNFQSSLTDDIFNPIPQLNRIKNSTGVSETGVVHNINFNWLDGKEIKDYYPDHWEYIAMNGSVFSVYAEGTSNLTYEQKGRWLQSPNWEVGQPFDGYGGAFPYVFPNVGYEWNNSPDDAENGDGLQISWWAGSNEDNDDNVDTTMMPNGEEVASIEHDYQWARWVKGESECLSYNKCLKFQADDKWNNIQDLLDESGATGPGVCPTWSDIYIEGENCVEGEYQFYTDDAFKYFKGKNTYNILALANNNQYRTINQSQVINQDGLSPYSSLKVSFMMKTIGDELYDAENPPEVEAGLLKVGDYFNEFLGYDGDSSTPVYDYSLDSGMGYAITAVGSMIYNIGGANTPCGFAFKPVQHEDGSYGWRLATEMGLLMDGCHVGNTWQERIACSGVPVPPNYTPTESQVDAGLPVYNAAKVDLSTGDVIPPGEPGGGGESGVCIDVDAFRFTYPDTLSCYDEFFNPYDSENPDTYYWLDAVYFGNRDFCTDPLFPYCTVYYESPNTNTTDYFCSNHITPPQVDGLQVHNQNPFIDLDSMYKPSYNSYTHGEGDKSEDDFGGMYRFKNNALNTWEKKEFTFTPANFNPNNFDYNLTFFVQAGNENFKGTVYLDNFEVIESQEFIPDVDVRKYLGPSRYGKGDLTKYYDPTIEEQVEAYNDTTAPLEAQFYFYPRYFKENVFDKTDPVYNDFRKGMFYIYNLDWGDGSPIEFLSEPEQLGDEKMIYHTYEKSGIYEITGFMLRLKYNEQEDPVGVIHNKRFTLKININEGLDEDFEYFGSDGFSFIPYKKTTPIIGGTSEQSIYYKSIKRNLGILDEEKIQTSFKSDGDRLKAELALTKMDASLNENFEILPNFETIRYTEPDGTGDIVYNGIGTYFEELGNSLGDIDITSVKYFSKPKQIWEVFPDSGEGGNSYESWKDPTYEPEEDDFDDGSDIGDGTGDGNGGGGVGDDVLPDDYGSGTDGTQNFCNNSLACNFGEAGECVFAGQGVINLLVKSATDLKENELQILYNTDEDGPYTAEWTYYDKTNILYDLQNQDETFGGGLLNTEGIGIFYSDVRNGATVETDLILQSMTGTIDDSSRLLRIEEVEVATGLKQTIFVNQDWYEEIVEGEDWYSDSPYAQTEITFREGYAYIFNLDNRIPLSPNPFDNGLGFQGNTGDTLTIPYYGCPSETPTIDMNQYPFGTVPAGGQCITDFDCKQYESVEFSPGPEYGELLEGGTYPIHFQSYCLFGVCQIPCEFRTMELPCWSNDECNIYDIYKQPGCIELDYHCSFDSPSENGQGTCAVCEYYPNQSFFNRTEDMCNGEYCLWPLIDDECVPGGGAECPDSGNNSCIDMDPAPGTEDYRCAGGLNIGEPCVPNDPDNFDFSSIFCPPTPSPYTGPDGTYYSQICGAAQSALACVGEEGADPDDSWYGYGGGGATEELQQFETGCEEDYQEAYVCLCNDADCPGGDCDEVPSCGMGYIDEAQCDSQCTYGNCEYTGEYYIGEDPGYCKYLTGIQLNSVAQLCPEGTTCQAVNNPAYGIGNDTEPQFINLCIDDSVTFGERNGDFLERFQASMRNDMHPGNPASARYWNNIWEGDIFDRTGIEEVTRYANTTNKYLETLKMPYYFEEFDYNGNGTLSLGVDGVLWRDEAKRPDIYERLELLLNDGDEDTPPHHTLSEDDEEIAEEQDDAPRAGHMLLQNYFPSEESLDNFDILPFPMIPEGHIDGVSNGLVTVEWVEPGAVKFTILEKTGHCVNNQCDNSANGLDGSGYCTHNNNEDGLSTKHCGAEFNFTQLGLPFELEEYYRISFRAKSDVPGTFFGYILAGGGDWIETTTDFQSYSFDAPNPIFTTGDEDYGEWGIVVMTYSPYFEDAGYPFSFTIDNIVIERTSGYFGELRPIEDFINPSIIKYVDVNTYSEQTWNGINTTIPYVSNIYYYPVLPKYSQAGNFTDPASYPNNNTPFPIDGLLTIDEYSEESLKMSITSETIDTNIYNDASGQGNYGFTMNDYKPRFDDETLQVKNVRTMGRIRTSNEDGAF